MSRWLRGVASGCAIALAAGALSVSPAGASTPAASLASFTAGATGATGAFGVPVSAVPPAVFSPAGTGQSTGVQSISLGRVSLGRVSLGRVSLGRVSLGRVSLGGTYLPALAGARTALGGMLLSDIPISYPSGCAGSACTNWPGVLAGTGLEFAPLQNVTLLEVLDNATANSRFESLTLVDLDLSRTALGQLPVSALLLSNVPLSHLPLPGSYSGSTSMAQWCGVLGQSPTKLACQADLGINPAQAAASDDDITLVVLALMGVDLSALPLDDIVLTGLDPAVLAGSPLGDSQVGNTNLEAASLGRVSLGRVDLANSSLGRVSLGRVSLGRVSLGRVSLGRVDLANTGTDAASLGRVSLGRVSLGRVSLGRVSLGRVSLGRVALGDISLGRVDLSRTSLGRVSLGRVSLGRVSTLSDLSLGRVDLSRTSLGRVSLGRVDIANASLGRVSLGRVSLAGTSLGRVTLDHISPLSSVVTCADPQNSIVGADCSTPATTTLAQILPDYLLGDLGNLYSALLPGATGNDAFNAQEIGALIAALAPTDTAAPGRGTTLAELLGGLRDQANDPAFAVTLQELLDSVSANDTVRSLTIAGLLNALASTDAAYAVTLEELMASLTDAADPAFAVTLVQLLDALAPTDPAFDTTLEELVAALAPGDPALGFQLSGLFRALKDSADPAYDITILQLLDALAAGDPVFADDLAHFLTAFGTNSGVSLEDLLLGLLGFADLPWEHLNLGAAHLQAAGAPQASAINYQAALAVTDDGAGSVQSVTLRVQVPDTFALKPGSVRVDGVAAPDPVAGTDPTLGATLTFVVPGLGVGTHTVAFGAWAGLSEGTETVVAQAGLDVPSLGSEVTAATNVADTTSSGDPATPVAFAPDTLYLGHISPQQTSNFFDFNSPGGERLSIRLGNLPADYDLVLYDLDTARPLRHAATRSVVPVDDPQLSLSPLGDTVQPETLQELPLVTGKRVYAVAMKRGQDDEQIDTGTLPPGHYLLQVSSYNGSSSPLPYTLRARATADPSATCARSATEFDNRFAFPTDVAPAFAPPAPTGAVDTLLIAQPDRLAATWGTGAVQGLWDQLGPFMTGYGKSKLVRLDDPANPHGIADAYAAWDHDPCSVGLANDVVRAIGLIIDDEVAANPAIRSVVMMGADDIVPMARLRDATSVANERDRGQDFSGQSNALVSSLSGGYVLTDDPYSSADPQAVGSREMFVPDLSVGRLLESPSEIGAALGYFTQQHGMLPASATSLVTGYDFLRDGANAVASALVTNAGGGRTNTSLNSDTWSRADLARTLLGAPAPGAANDPALPVPDIASVNAHFDEQNALPALGNTSKSQASLFTVDDAAAAGTTVRGGVAQPTLQGRVLFSMGCHAGLNLSDKIGLTGSTKDWAQTFADQQAIWIANTGYGYGDTDSVAFSERLMSLVADQLDRSPTLGAALVAAKQRYAGGLAMVSPYDEKALQEATYYGLPMWSLPTPKTGPAPALTPAASAPSSIGGLRTADVSKSLTDNGTTGTGDSQFRLVQDAGTTSLSQGHYDVAGQTLSVPRRPIQPRVEADVTADSTRDPSLAGFVAKGALITALGSKDIVGFKPDYYRPSIDDASNESPQDVGDAAFPAGLQSVTTYGKQQRLVVVPGQFRPTPGLATPGRGTERLYTNFTARVFYGPESDPDDVAPTILQSSAAVTGSTVTITAKIVDLGTQSKGVAQVQALFTQSGTWTVVNNFQPVGDPTDNTYVGTGTVSSAGKPVDYYLQAVDGSGNVGRFANKGAFFNAQNLASQGPLKFKFTSSFPGASGWFRGPVTVGVTAPSITSNQYINYSLDGGATLRSPGKGSVNITIPDEGVHTLVAWQTGQQLSRVQILIDASAPVPGVDFPSGGRPNAAGWTSKNPIDVSIVPLDPREDGSGVETINYSASGATTIGAKTVPQPAVGAPPVTETLSADGITNFSVKGLDRAGNVGLSGVFDVRVDSTKPVATLTPDSPPNAAGWRNAIPTLTLAATDPAPGSGSGQVASGVSQVAYQVNGGDVVFTSGDTTTVPLGEGRNRVQYFALDNADNQSDPITVLVNVDLTSPTSAVDLSPLENGGGWERTPTTVTFSSVDPNGPDARAGSGVSKVTYSTTKDPSKGGAVVPSTDIAGGNGAYVLNTEGITTFRYQSTDVAGNVEGPPNTRVVRLDMTAPTKSCAAFNGAWSAVNLSFACTTADPMSGLADSTDGSFQLTTNLPAGQESPTVSTDSRTVPDVAGNTTVVGPITNVKIDRKPPSISLVLPSSNPFNSNGPSPVPEYIIGQPANVRFGCTDPGSGVKTCVGKDNATATPITKFTNWLLDTSTVGLHTFNVTTTDNVGNTATTSQTYRVVYGICRTDDPNRISKVGSTVEVEVKLCNWLGSNLSASNVALTAVGVNNTGGLLSANVGGPSPIYSFKYDSKAREYRYSLKTDARFWKWPTRNWIAFRVSNDPGTPVPTVAQTTDLTYLNQLYRAYFLLK